MPRKREHHKISTLVDFSVDSDIGVLKFLDENLKRTFSFFSPPDGDTWHLDLKNGAGAAGKGAPPGGDPDVTMTLTSGDFVSMFAGKLDATSAFMTGKLKIKGNMALAMKLQKLMKTLNKSKL